MPLVPHHQMAPRLHIPPHWACGGGQTGRLPQRSKRCMTKLITSRLSDRCFQKKEEKETTEIITVHCSEGAMWFHFWTSGHLKKNTFILTVEGNNGFKSYHCFINKPSLKVTTVNFKTNWWQHIASVTANCSCIELVSSVSCAASGADW